MTPQRWAGRPRDARATESINAAALRQLAEVGYARMSMESVAAEAGVARATVYRRYADKAELVTAAMSERLGPPPVAGDRPLAQLIRYVEEFDLRIAASCVEVVGCLLADRDDPETLSRHRERVVQPRVAALESLLEHARDLDLLRADADLGLVLHMLVGAVLARRVLGLPHEPGWARRAVETACRGVATAEGVAQVRGVDAPRPAVRSRTHGTRAVPVRGGAASRDVGSGPKVAVSPSAVPS
jgi:AcrR family transcriptional regulator